MKDFYDTRWELFLQIINKQDLDLKGEMIKDYASNFSSAFIKANNIAEFYENMSAIYDNEQTPNE